MELSTAASHRAGLTVLVSFLPRMVITSGEVVNNEDEIDINKRLGAASRSLLKHRGDIKATMMQI